MNLFYKDIRTGLQNIIRWKKCVSLNITNGNVRFLQQKITITFMRTVRRSIHRKQVNKNEDMKNLINQRVS